MSGYSDIEAQLLALIKTVERFADRDEPAAPLRATRGDYSLLDRGVEDAVILTPGTASVSAPEWEMDRPSPLRETQWSVIITLFRRYGQGRVVSTDLAESRDELLDLINQYPSLNGACGMTYLVSVETMGDPEDVFDRAGGGPFYQMQAFRVTYSETVNVTGGEY